MDELFKATDWNQYAKSYDALNKLRPYSDMLDQVTMEVRGSREPILDAGCGTGNLIQRLVQLTSGTIVGIDASEEMLTRARQKGMGVQFIRSNLDACLPFKSGTFCAITCVNALYALLSPLETLRRFARLLCDDGLLVITTPKYGYENGLILKSHCGSIKSDSYWCATHKDRQREEDLIREAAGSDEVFTRELIEIARFNRVITRENSFHFLTARQLVDIVEKAGFVVHRISDTYAEQNHLLIAKHMQQRNWQ